MSTIAHLSDLHFGRARAEVIDALQRELSLPEPDLIVVSGDLTQRARPEEFKTAKIFLDRLSAPTLVVPGNHDIPLWSLPTRFTRPWHRWRRYISTNQMPIIRGNGFIAVGVNTARRCGSLLDWSRGRINKTQLDAVTDALAEARDDEIRILAAHHPFLLTPSNLHRGLVGRALEALNQLNRARVDLILCGHVHQGYAGISWFRGVTGPVVVQAATAVSERLKGEPNGYNRIRLKQHRIEVEILRCTDARFTLHSRKNFRRTGQGWISV